MNEFAIQIAPLKKPKDPNFVMAFQGLDEEQNAFRFQWVLPRTLKNRVKYWLFCMFFPFYIKEWRDE